MEGKNAAEIKTKFSDVYVTGLKANYTVWPAVQGINFGLVPLPYRLPFQQGCGIVWTVSLGQDDADGKVFLSLLNARQDKKAELREQLIPEKSDKKAA